MVTITTLLTALAAIASIFAIDLAASNWAEEPSIIQLAIPSAVVSFLFLSRLAASISPGGSNPAIYNEEWKLDPNANDEQNLVLKARLDRQIKLYSLIVVAIGFVIAILIT